MSIQSQENNMRKLARLLSGDLSYIWGERESGPSGDKKVFLNTGKAFLRALVRDLTLRDAKVTANAAGIAVSGECYLTGMWEDSGLHVCLEQPCYLRENVLCYVSLRAELTFSKLKMNRVAISLYDVVKTTGEAKDVFRFTYNGRRYDRLSLSEKIRAGMEVSELMKRLTGRNYPVFVDNMESVEELSNVRPTGQVIMAKCIPMADLSVKAGGVNRTQSKAA